MMYDYQFHDPKTFADVVDFVCQHLRPIDFDVVVFRGISGAVVAPTVALNMGKHWACVRKRDDSTHSCHRIEGHVLGQYVIVDDFIDSGATTHAILYEVRHCYPRAVCQGVFFYSKSWHERTKDSSYRGSFEEKMHGRIPILNWQQPASDSATKIDLSRRQREWEQQQEIVRQQIDPSGNRPFSMDPDEWKYLISKAESAVFSEVRKQINCPVPVFLGADMSNPSTTTSTVF